MPPVSYMDVLRRIFSNIKTSPLTPRVEGTPTPIAGLGETWWGKKVGEREPYTPSEEVAPYLERKISRTREKRGELPSKAMLLAYLERQGLVPTSEPGMRSLADLLLGKKYALPEEKVAYLKDIETGERRILPWETARKAALQDLERYAEVSRTGGLSSSVPPDVEVLERGEPGNLLEGLSAKRIIGAPLWNPSEVKAYRRIVEPGLEESGYPTPPKVGEWEAVSQSVGVWNDVIKRSPSLKRQWEGIFNDRLDESKPEAMSAGDAEEYFLRTNMDFIMNPKAYSKTYEKEFKFFKGIRAESARVVERIKGGFEAAKGAPVEIPLKGPKPSFIPSIPKGMEENPLNPSFGESARVAESEKEMEMGGTKRLFKEYVDYSIKNKKPINKLHFNRWLADYVKKGRESLIPVTGE